MKRTPQHQAPKVVTAQIATVTQQIKVIISCPVAIYLQWDLATLLARFRLVIWVAPLILVLLQSLLYMPQSSQRENVNIFSSSPPPFPLSSFTSLPSCADGKGFIGIYSAESRKERIERFVEKRKRRVWTKKVKYDVRKNFADSRLRVKVRPFPIWHPDLSRSLSLGTVCEEGR
jgi:hypothetical protein